MYCVMRASVPSLYNVYRRYDSRSVKPGYHALADSLTPTARTPTRSTLVRMRMVE